MAAGGNTQLRIKESRIGKQQVAAGGIASNRSVGYSAHAMVHSFEDSSVERERKEYSGRLQEYRKYSEEGCKVKLEEYKKYSGQQSTVRHS